jgi:putative transcriptional regulator
MAVTCSLDIELTVRNLTAKALAKQIGVTEATISKLRRNQFSQIDAKTLGKICKALDLQPGELLHYEPDDA